VVKHREIDKKDIFTKNIMKKAQNDIEQEFNGKMLGSHFSQI